MKHIKRIKTMEQYISKSALVAEIKRLFEKAEKSSGEYQNGAIHTLITFRDFLDTNEVKEVNSKDAFIEKACDAYCKVCGHYAHSVPTHICRHDCRYFSDFKKHMEE